MILSGEEECLGTQAGWKKRKPGLEGKIPAHAPRQKSRRSCRLQESVLCIPAVCLTGACAVCLFVHRAVDKRGRKLGSASQLCRERLVAEQRGHGVSFSCCWLLSALERVVHAKPWG